MISKNIFEPGIEVSGRAVYSTLDGMGKLKILDEYDILGIGIGSSHDGINVIDLDKWYSMEQWLKVIDFIYTAYGEKILFQIGYSIPDNALFPPLGDTIEEGIKIIDTAFHMNHRKNNLVMFDEKTGIMQEGIGHYHSLKVENENRIISECDTPYPCSFDKGILACMAKKFKADATVVEDNTKPCRKNGESSCTYIISW